MNLNRKLNDDQIQADREALVALRAMADYRPANNTYTVLALDEREAAMIAAQQEVVRVQNMLAAARDARDVLELRFHNDMSEAKQQVRAQYGMNSDEVQAMGLKKRSDYRRPRRKAAATS